MKMVVAIVSSILALAFFGCSSAPDSDGPTRASDVPLNPADDPATTPNFCVFGLGQHCVYQPAGTTSPVDVQAGVCDKNNVCCGGCIDERGDCNVGDSVSVCGHHGIACAECDDGLSCTNDACDPAAGCYHVNHINSPCPGGGGYCDPSDGTCCNGFFEITQMGHQCVTACPACTVPDVGGVCIPSPDPSCLCASDAVCNDNNPCTSDHCDGASSHCVSTPVADGILCSMFPAMFCTAGMCR